MNKKLLSVESGLLKENKIIMSTERHDDYEDDNGAAAVAPAEPELQKPPMFKVLLLNDDYTTMDFVIMILEDLFYKTSEEAERIMLQIHHEGHGVCGVFTREIAETKVQQVVEASKENGHPLQCIMDKE